MKQITFALLLTLSAGCINPSPPTVQVAAHPKSVIASPAVITNPKVEITIGSANGVFKSGDEITISIRIKNLTDKNMDAPTTYWSAVLLLDGNEHKRLPKHIGDWNGPGVIIAGGEFCAGMSLSEYGITKEILSVGKHEVRMKIGENVSNPLTITITADN